MGLTTDNAFRWQFSAMTGAEISPDLCGKSSDTTKRMLPIRCRGAAKFPLRSPLGVNERTIPHQ